MSPATFLTARWQSLLLLNYRCRAEHLAPLVPAGTVLDAWEGACLISLVGFRFLDTRVLGVAVPGHRDFEEVNLRFYVRRDLEGEVRRGVVFVRELVPRRLIASVARAIYNEPYAAVRMSHTVELHEGSGGRVTYRWWHTGQEHTLEGSATGPARLPDPGSEAEFITEHYWGYTRRRDGGTLEYRVEHPQWQVWSCDAARYTAGGGGSLYGPTFSEALSAEPVSAFLAVGSSVSVHRGVRLAGAG